MSRRKLTRQLMASVTTVLVFATSARADLEDLVITEVQALNQSTVTDENGDYPDWFEVFNAGASSQSLSGCYATDDATELTKWRFPSVTLPPGAFRVVFCSDKDRRSAGGELHTNFKLSSEGDFLALVAPNGRRILSSFAPTYPPLLEDFSYGFRMDASFFRLVDRSTPLKVRVPTSGDAAVASNLSWARFGFNDASWESGFLGVGYDDNPDYNQYIGKDVTSTLDGTNTSIWIRIPFDVDDPNDVGAMSLRVRYDDGFIAYINGTEVADANAPASPADWDANASADHTDPAAVIFDEWSFSSAGLLRSGDNILAIHGLNRSTTSSDFLIDADLEAGGGGGSLDLNTLEFFDLPTPGAGNVPGFPGVSPKPILDPANQVFNGNLTLQIDVPSPEAEIRYTLNRSQPTESSRLYTGPINLSTTTFVRAVSFISGRAPSPVVAGTYLTMDSSLRTRSSNIPIVVVDTLGGSIPATGSTTFGPAFMVVFERQPNGRASFSDVPQIANRIGIKARGSSSAGRPKKSYRFEFWDDQDEDRDFAPLGLPSESDWILYGAYNFDQAHMRNPFIYEVSRQAGRWAARTRFVEVYLNTNGGTLTSGDYWGVYSFMESVKRGKDRVDIERLSPAETRTPEIQGGYILKKDRGDPGGSGSFSAGGVGSIQFSYPDTREVNSQQRSWIQNHLGPVFSASNPMSGVIDPLAAIDHHILNAMPKNVDAFRLSGYFYKPRFGPVEFGPIWDFDRSMDSTDGRDNAYNTWRGSGDSSGYFGSDGRTPYWQRWLNTADFLQLWVDRWFEMREPGGPMSTANVFGIIDRMRAELSEAGPRDNTKWRQGTFSSAVSRLRSWLGNRVSWIDTQWLRPPRLSRPGGKINPGTTVSITGSGGAIYYTLNGADPRRSGGSTSTDAIQYSGSISLDDNARIVARILASNSRWSAPVAATYVVTTPPLVVSELMFHPLDPDPDSPYDSDDFEFVEVMNVGDQPLELEGAHLGGGLEFAFSDSFGGGGAAVLAPGQRVVVVSNLAAFATRYGTNGIAIAGQYERRLNNAGDTVIFEGPLLEPIHSFFYFEDWYPETDGLGPSLNIVDPYLGLETWPDKDFWASSSVLDGTPGTADTGLEGEGGWQIPGDGNQDGHLDIGDALTLLIHLFVGGLELPCDGASIDDGSNRTLMNLNGDAGADSSDVIYLLTYLFRAGPEPQLGSNCIRIEGCSSSCR